MNVLSRIIRKPAVKEMMGYGSDSTVYLKIKEGVFVPPFKIGGRASGWIQHECEVINAARIAGKTEDEIRDLVKTLVTKRQQLANEILAAA